MEFWVLLRQTLMVLQNSMEPSSSLKGSFAAKVA